MRRNSGAMGFEFFPRPLRPEVWERFRRRRKHEGLPQGKNIVYKQVEHRGIGRRDMRKAADA